jgi:hypothetical protein
MASGIHRGYYTGQYRRPWFEGLNFGRDRSDERDIAAILLEGLPLGRRDMDGGVGERKSAVARKQAAGMSA